MSAPAPARPAGSACGRTARLLAPAAPLVVGLDGTAPAEAALAWAAPVAAASGSPLVLLAAAPPGDVREAEHAARLLAAGAARAVRIAASLRRGGAVRPGGLDVRTEVVPGPAAAALAGAGAASLLVVGSRGRGPLAGAVLGSVSADLLRTAEHPVVVVRAGATVRQLVGGAGTPVLAAVDGSPASREAALLAGELAAATGAPLRLVAVAAAPEDEGAAPCRSPERLGDVLEEVADAVREWWPGLDVAREVLRGHVVPALVRASWSAGAVVVGSRGARGGAAPGLGSTSAALVRAAHCPVAVVPARARRGRLHP